MVKNLMHTLKRELLVLWYNTAAEISLLYRKINSNKL